MRLIDEIHENRLLSTWAKLLPRRPGQVGSIHETDAELIPLGDGRLLALTVDAVIEEIAAGIFHDPFTAGRTAVVSSLADLAAVGADPLGVLLSVTLPDGEPSVQERVAAGVGEACSLAGTYVLGGDTNEGSEHLEITVAAAGLVPEGEQLTRTGLQPGDRLYAAGPLGAGSAIAAAVLLDLPDSVYTEDDYRPPPRVKEGVCLRGIANACMDTSDGLIATLDQLARLNGVGIRVDNDAQALLDEGARRVSAATGLSAPVLLAGHHGEFELVFAVPPGRTGLLEAAAQAIDWTPIPVGEAAEGSGVSLAGHVVDTARIRNLLPEVGGDLEAYLAGLIALLSEEDA
jgi:thiamine-monophosphate kinase